MAGPVLSVYSILWYGRFDKVEYNVTVVTSLNYHHLRLFRAVAREGNLTRASKKLCLTPQTVSTQIRDLESDLGEALFTRAGRNMRLTDVGRVVLGYANEIFTVGQELREALRGLPTERPLRLMVGVANVLPKIIAHRLIEPALKIGRPVRVVCEEGTPEKLLSELSVHRLDVVLSDAPIPNNVRVRAFNHHLGTCGVSLMAHRSLAGRLRKGFPDELTGAPLLLPTADTALRSKLDAWFQTRGIQPTVAGEFEDSALLKAFGQAGVGAFAVPSVIENEVSRQYRVKSIGVLEDVTENFYAISVERRVQHPGIMAICDAARSELFA